MSRQRRSRQSLAVLLGASLACAWLVAQVPAARANVSVISYSATDWKYRTYSPDPPPGWSEAGFDDAGFAVGCAPFGVQGTCEIGVCTAWPLETRIVLRRGFDLPSGTRRVLVFTTLDDEVAVYVNGTLLGTEASSGDACSGYNRAMFSAPGAILQPTGNVIAVLGYGYGSHSLLAVAVDADVSVPPPPPPPQPPSAVYGCAATDARADHVLVTWYAAMGQDGYRVYRDGQLVGSPGQMETSFTDTPPLGTHIYCVEAYNSVGPSAQCCDAGTRLPYLAPTPCGASDAGSKQLLVNWTDVDGEDGYHIYRGSELVHTAGPNEITYADYPVPGTYTYCVEAFGALGTSPACCDIGTRLPLPMPFPCGATDDSPTEVRVTWKNVDGEDGYHIFRGGALMHTAGPEETSWSDTPEPGTYSYCVEAFNAQGVSPQCCDNGTRRAPTPSPCGASNDRMDGVQITWTDVAGESGYRVFRGSTLVTTTGPDATSCFDAPEIGSYVYCVEVFYSSGATARCCNTGQRLALPVPSPCGASDADPAGVLVTWTAVPAADGYRVYRDGTLSYTAAPEVTSWRDTPAVGVYMYCVTAFNANGASPQCCDSGTRAPSAPSPCDASDSRGDGVQVTWTDVTGESGYRVYRGATLVASTGADATSYFDTPAVGAYEFCVEAFYASGQKARCCDVGTRLALSSPSPCGASDDRMDGIRVTWTDVAGESGYRVYRGSTLVTTTGPDESYYLDTPAVGTYSYCVEVFYPSGGTAQCCDIGTRHALPGPASCGATDDDAAGVTVTWAAVTGADGYRVYRDGTIAYTAPPELTSWRDTPAAGTYLYCVAAFNASGASSQCCDSGRRPILPIPSPCGASDANPNGVLVTWTAVPAADGYRVYRDEALIHVAGASETSHLDVPLPGTYSYCVEAVYPSGTSARCCDSGRRPALAGPSSCDATDTDTTGVLVTWAEVIGADGYRIYRDDALVHAAPPGEASYFDVPQPGSYSYCIEAYNAAGPSARCCDSGRRFSSAAQLVCSATDSLSTWVAITWTPVPGVSGYRIYRDGVLVRSAGAGETSWSDSPSPDTYTYCVEPFNGSTTWTACCDEGTRLVAAPGGPETVRLSWGTCTPMVVGQGWGTPGVYKLVLSAASLAGGFNGHDTNVYISPWLVDAWRFDNGGCQGPDYFHASTAALNKSCPALLGTAPLSIVNYGYDASVQIGIIRLANTFNEFTADPSVRYTLWQLSFDHTFSVPGPTDPGVTCGGAQMGEYFHAETEFLHADGRVTSATGPDRDVYFNGGAVRGQRTTWGRVKATYR
jgi:hypothetical protein